MTFTLVHSYDSLRQLISFFCYFGSRVYLNYQKKYLIYFHKDFVLSGKVKIVQLLEALKERGIITQNELNDMKTHMVDYVVLRNRMDMSTQEIELKTFPIIMKNKDFTLKGKANAFWEVVENHCEIKDFKTPERERRYILFMKKIEEIKNSKSKN